MELIATARFKQAMDRAMAATGYTKRITQVVADLAKSGLEVSHPLLEKREEKNSALLILTSNRGLCGGYNGNVLRAAVQRKVGTRIRIGSFATSRIRKTWNRWFEVSRNRSRQRVYTV